MRLSLVIASLALLWAAPGAVLDPCEDAASFRQPKEKVKVEAVAGHDGKALQFSFEQGCQSAFAMSKVRGAPEWDQAAGVSFWVKGDGSQSLGGLQLIWNDDFSVRYDASFSVAGKEWQKVAIPWRDFIPVLANPKSAPLDPKANAPSKITAVWVGKWWYWRDYPAQTFALDDLRLEPEIALDKNDYRPAEGPLARTLAKLKAGQPVTIVTMGDSLTDYRHWANKPANWPTLLKEAVAKQYKSELTIVNPAIGGTELKQNLVLIPRWLATTPAPDLVTICFGFNDFSSGMRGETFNAAQQDAIDRVRRATGGKSDVLVITSCPAATKWDDLAEMAEACRQASAARNAGLADTYAAFHAAGKENPEKLFASDKVHLSPDGHRVFAETVLSAIANGGKSAK